MEELLIVIFIGLWTYFWYMLGKLDAKLDEIDRRLRNLCRDIERQRFID